MDQLMFSRRRLGSVILFIVVVLSIYGLDRLPAPSVTRVFLMLAIGVVGGYCVRNLWRKP